jgi:aconitate hydratase 2/2-methylisocitrate dehydratase
VEFIKAGGSYAIVFGKKTTDIAATTLNIDIPQVYAASKKEFLLTGSYRSRKIFNKNAVGTTQANFAWFRCACRSKYCWVLRIRLV